MWGVSIKASRKGASAFGNCAARILQIANTNSRAKLKLTYCRTLWSTEARLYLAKIPENSLSVITDVN